MKMLVHLVQNFLLKQEIFLVKLCFVVLVNVMVLSPETPGLLCSRRNQICYELIKLQKVKLAAYYLFSTKNLLLAQNA